MCNWNFAASLELPGCFSVSMLFFAIDMQVSTTQALPCRRAERRGRGLLNAPLAPYACSRSCRLTDAKSLMAVSQGRVGKLPPSDINVMGCVSGNVRHWMGAPTKPAQSHVFGEPSVTSVAGTCVLFVARYTDRHRAVITHLAS